MESQSKSIEEQLFDAISQKNLDLVKRLKRDNPKINLNCLDKDELTPLQHACHTGDYKLAEFLLDNGAGLNFTSRKDGYTPLMFAAISSRIEVVRLLLERGVDTTIENCVHRTAAQMAAFVGQYKIVSVINSWVPYESSVEFYTKRRELETEPRIPTASLGRLLHSYIVYPSLHPVKLLLYIKDNPDLMKHARECIYVLENLSSKALQPPMNEEYLSLKYYFLSYLIEYCHKAYKAKYITNGNISGDFDVEKFDKVMKVILRRLIKRNDPEDIKACTLNLDRFILECLMKYPYTQLAIFKTMTFALTKRDPGDLTALGILNQTLNGPRTFGQPAEACAVCTEVYGSKKCSKCKSIYYCDPSCQKADWFQHEKVCRDPEEEPLLKDDGHSDDIQ